jgi:hypothetical protein
LGHVSAWGSADALKREMRYGLRVTGPFGKEQGKQKYV